MSEEQKQSWEAMVNAIRKVAEGMGEFVTAAGKVARESRTLEEAIEAIRDAGGDSWDDVACVECYLRRGECAACRECREKGASNG